MLYEMMLCRVCGAIVSDGGYSMVCGSPERLFC